MASVTFYLNKNKIDKRGRAPIILQFDHKKQRFKYYTGEKIYPNYWSHSNNYFIKPSYKDDCKLDDYLRNLENKIHNIVRDLKIANRTITPELVKYELLNSSNQDIAKTFFPLFNEYLIACEGTKVKGTIRNYKNALHYFNDYKDHSGFEFEFERLNMAFYEAFVKYLISVKELSNNTIGRVIKILKTYLNWTVENGYHTNLVYKKFKIFKEKIEIIYLTDKELNTIFNYKTTNEPLAKARDLFCFGCYTGLRFSDITQLDKSNIENDVIHIRTQKTKDLLAIPLLPQAKQILKKYNYNLPILSNQKLNKHLKTLGSKTKINQLVSIQRYRGANRIDKEIPKFNLITTHTARRTFITLSLEKGIRQEVVMSITGHKDFKSFSAYIKIVDNIKKEELLNAWQK